MTFSAPRADVDNAPPTGDRRCKRAHVRAEEARLHLDDQRRRHKSGARKGNQTNLWSIWSVPRSQPRAPGPSPDSTKFGTSGSTQTRPKRTMTMKVTHSLKVEPSCAGHLALQALASRSRALNKGTRIWKGRARCWLRGVSGGTRRQYHSAEINSNDFAGFWN